MDVDKLNEVQANVKESAEYLNSVVDSTVDSYTKALDDIMSRIYNDVISVDNASTDTIEKYFLELSNCLYFISEKCEKVGIFDGVSKVAAQEAYNKTYLNHQQSTINQVGAKKPTVAESTAVAENGTIYDNMINEMYSRSYKIIKNKLDAAQTMVSTLSKVISRRMSEANLSVTSNSSRILNESVQDNNYFK